MKRIVLLALLLAPLPILAHPMYATNEGNLLKARFGANSCLRGGPVADALGEIARRPVGIPATDLLSPKLPRGHGGVKPPVIDVTIVSNHDPDGGGALVP